MIAAFAASCRDAPGSAEPRRAHLHAHLARVEEVMNKLLIAGPLKDAAGEMVGSLIVFAADSEEEARALLAGDPYFQHGVWDEIRIERFLPVAGTLVGGWNW